MNQIKKAIAWMKANRFWLGSLFTALTMIGAWFFVSMQIADRTQKNTATVTGSISKAKSILTVSAEEAVKAHPNATTEKGMAELLGKSAEELIKAWEVRYNSQVKILKWPKELLDRKEFTDHFDVHNPPETYPLVSEQGIQQFSTLYRNEVPKQMERICSEILRAKWNYVEKKKGAEEEEKLTPAEELNRFAVVWDEKNQQLWENKLRSFRGYDDHKGTVDGPTGLQIYMLQQDLWLLEAMFQVVREVNGDVTSNDLAKIKKIDHVVFGRDIGRDPLGKLTPIQMPATITATADAAAAAPATPAAAEVAFNPFSSNKAFHGRYVTADYKPISAETVMKVIEAVKSKGPLPEGNLELIVAKRVPVRIALQIDEREIPNFIKACANSPFAFEIQQVRKNRHVPGQGIARNGGASGASTIVGGSRDGGDMEADMSGGGRGGDARGGDSRGGAVVSGGTATGGAAQGLEPGKIKAEIRTNYDIDAEFYGIVRIYNPVNSESEDGFRGGDYLRKLVNPEGAQASVRSPASDQKIVAVKE